MKYLVKYSSDGRITLPREVRQELKLQGGTDLALYIENGKVVVEKTAETCIICGSEDVTKLSINKGDTIIEASLCRECRELLRNMK